MSDTYTLVIERRDGEDIDVDQIREILGDDYKVSASGPGDHFLVSSMLRRAKEDLATAGSFVAMALGEAEPEE